MAGSERSRAGAEKRVVDRAAPTVPVNDRREHWSAGGLLLDVQSRAGNSATVELLRRAQARLDVGSSDDPCEVEAEAVAQRVVGFLHGVSPSEAITSSESAAAPVVRRTAESDQGGPVPAETESAIGTARRSGRSLPSGVRTAMEEAFGGADFSAVRLHSGGQSEVLNRQLSAQAFTVGSDIFFRDGLPDSGRAGQALLAHELTHTIQQGATAGSRVQRRGGKKDKAPVGAHTVKIGSERVNVADEAEEEEAKAIIKRLKSLYGIKLASGMTVAAIKKEYGDVPEVEKAKLEESVWEMKELRSVEAAVSHYAPILGSKRKKSTLAKKAQGITSIGRVKQAIDQDSDTGKLDSTTLGEQFSSKKNVGLFDASTNYLDNEFTKTGEVGPSNTTSLEATAIHEMAHGLVQPYHLSDWVTKMTYWLDEDTASGTIGAEDPPTNYGETNAAEDLCESVAMYFINPGAFKASHPERFGFLDAVVKQWTPVTKKKVVTKASTSKGGGK